MGTARAELTVPGSVHEAETLWYDTSRWPTWVTGLAHVAKVPAGRGHVVERVVAYEKLSSQTVEVEDETMRGRQSVAFTPLDGSVQIELSLEYQVKERSLFTPVIDFFFIRRALAGSLLQTLKRFGFELRAERELVDPSSPRSAR
jgi:hypothetical protein